ncbi:MAG: hypothetical protein WC587_00800 [Candidatus Paceibacterota bacterium]
MSKNFLIIVLAIILAGGILVLSINLKIKKAEAKGLIPFGGRILYVTYCTCSGGLLLTIGPPRPGNYYFTAGSRVYAYYQIYRPGAWALGDAFPGGACMIYAGTSCVGSPTTGTIRQVGTSLR